MRIGQLEGSTKERDHAFHQRGPFFNTTQEAGRGSELCLVDLTCRWVKLQLRRFLAAGEVKHAVQRTRLNIR